MARLRDGRRPGWFWADNRVLGACMTLGPLRGLRAFAVYCSIATHCDGKNRTAYVSYTTLAGELRADRRRAIEAIKDLDGLGLLKVEPRKTKYGAKAANLYTLLDPPEADLFNGGRRCSPRTTDGVVDAPPMVFPTHHPRCSPRTTDGVVDALASFEQEPGEQEPVNKTSAATAAAASRVRDELFDTVAEVTGTDVTVAASHIGKVCRLLRIANPPYTPEEVRRWAEMVTNSDWWKGGLPSLSYLEKNIGRVRAKEPPRRTRPAQEGFYEGLMTFVARGEPDR